MIQKNRLGMSLQMAPVLKIHQAIARECSQHVLCEDCYRHNSEGPLCGILKAPTVVRRKKIAKK